MKYLTNMTDVNSINAVAHHRAKLREKVIKLPFENNEFLFNGETIIKRADVLKLLNHY